MLKNFCKLKQSERGVAITEAAIVIPLWIIFLLIFGELYSYLNSYMQLQQLLREGLEMAATMPELEKSNTPVTNYQLSSYSQFANCVYFPPFVPGTFNRTDCGSYILHNRLARLAQNYNLRVKGDPYSNINIASQRTATDEIQLNLSYTYRPLMGHFMGVTMRASGRGPYLCGAVSC